MLHYEFLRELDEALQAGTISTEYHYQAKRVMRAAQMSGCVLRSLEEIAAAIQALRENGGVTERQIYHPRYC